MHQAPRYNFTLVHQLNPPPPSFSFILEKKLAKQQLHTLSGATFWDHFDNSDMHSCDVCLNVEADKLIN